jgi:hypothetical protein
VGLDITYAEADFHTSFETSYGYQSHQHLYIGNRELVTLYQGFHLQKSAYWHMDDEMVGWSWYAAKAGVSGFMPDSNTDGAGSIALSQNGSSIDYEFVTPVGTASGTVSGVSGTVGSCDTVAFELTLGNYEGGSVDKCAFRRVAFTRNGVPYSYPWDAPAELDAWTYAHGATECAVTSGEVRLLSPITNTTWDSLYYNAPAIGGALTSVLSAPGIQRIAAVSSANGLQDRYASGALADILTGSLADNHPELVHVGASGHHLGLVWQRSNDICITTGTGVPGITGWPNTVQTVALARSKPTACVIDPTHDLGVAYLQGSNALFSPAAWANGSYVMGTETIISSGDVADERGQLLQSTDGYLLYVYRDTSGAVIIKRSANRGQTWS